MRIHFDDKTLEPVYPVLAPGEKLHIPVYQDETILRSNELRRRVWAKGGKLPLRKKGQGKSLHISDFILELFGRLKLTTEQIEELRGTSGEDEELITDAREIIYPGKNSDGWWNAQRLINQVNNKFPHLHNV